MAELKRQRGSAVGLHRRLAAQLETLRTKQQAAIERHAQLLTEVKRMKAAVQEAERDAEAAQEEETAAAAKLQTAKRAEAGKVAEFRKWQDKCGQTFAYANALDKETGDVRKGKRAILNRNNEFTANLAGVNEVVDALKEQVATERAKRKELQAKCRERLAREASEEEKVAAKLAEQEEECRTIEEKMNQARNDELDAARMAASLRATIADTQELATKVNVEVENLRVEVRASQDVNRHLAEILLKVRDRKREIERQQREKAAYGKVPAAAYELLAADINN